MTRKLPLSSLSSILSRRFICNPRRTPTNKSTSVQGVESLESVQSVKSSILSAAKFVTKATDASGITNNNQVGTSTSPSTSSLTSTSAAFTSFTSSTSELRSKSTPAPRRSLIPPSAEISRGRTPLLDQFGISLTLPFTEFAVFTVSAILGFRHDYWWSTNHTNHTKISANQLHPDSDSITPTTRPIISNMIITGEKGQAKLNESSSQSPEIAVTATAQSATSTAPTITAANAVNDEVGPPAYSQVISQTGAIATSSKWSSAARSPTSPSHSSTADRDFTSVDGTHGDGTRDVVPGPANYVHVFRRDGSIRGVWNINPALVVPQSFLAIQEEARNVEKSFFKKAVEQEPIPWDQRPNLTLHTRDGRISAHVWISDSQVEDAQDNEKTKYTSMDLNTKDGDVLLRVRTHGTRPLKIKMHTNDGAIRVFLPRSFVGPLIHNIRDGKVVFSPAMQSSATQFSMVEGKSGTSFLGDWHSSMSGPEAKIDQWEGDRCEVSTKDGSVYFFWEDEFEAFSNRKGKWLRNIFQMD